MGFSIKNREVEALAAEVARITGENKTEAIRNALAERRQRLLQESDSSARVQRIRRLFVEEIWPLVPLDVRGRPVTRREWEKALGYHGEGA